MILPLCGLAGDPITPNATMCVRVLVVVMSGEQERVLSAAAAESDAVSQAAPGEPLFCELCNVSYKSSEVTEKHHSRAKHRKVSVSSSSSSSSSSLFFHNSIL